MDVSFTGTQPAWDQALTSYTYPPFTQLWAWGEAQKALGKGIVRQYVQTSAGPVLAQWVQERRGPFVYWFCPQGPVFPTELSSPERESVLNACEAALPAQAQTLFTRIEPRLRAQQGNIEERQSWDGGRRVRSLNPSTSYVVPLHGSPDDVLERMHKKTRYNIRLAERHAVIVRGGTPDDIPVFMSLLKQTEERDGFTGHDEHYLRTICTTLCQFGNARFRIAECLGKPLAANLEVLCGDTIMYLYGASSSEDREKMAPYALQWSAIYTAIQEGRRWYDFGGGNPQDETSIDFRPSWDGITRFKERWGTVMAAEPGTYDRIRRPWLYKLFVRR